MGRPYGKLSYRRARARSPRAAGSAANVRIKIKGRYDLEQISLLLQRMIARLEDSDVASIEHCAVYLTPLGRGGETMLLKDREDKPIDTIALSLPISAKFGGAAVK
jgi:hypothetical protein